MVVSADGHHLDYHLNEKGKLSTASEDIGNPVVSGHSLFGFILSHWEVLAEKITYVVLHAF